MRPKLKFNNDISCFSKSLKKNINLYFKNNNQQKTGTKKLFLKSIVLITTLLAIYILLLSNTMLWSVNLFLCVLFGVNLAAIGFNIMHDAGHNSFSNNKKLNHVLSYSLNLLGGNIYFWKLKHNIAHHTFTNIDGHDHDIEVKFMRIHPDQPLKKHHRYQTLYFPILYGVSYLAWIFYQDYEKYFRQRLGGDAGKFNFPKKEKLIFWISKIVHFTIFIIIPIIYVGIIPTLVGLTIAGIVCGLCLATVFQLAHVVKGTEFKTIGTDKVEQDWMVHQIQSTSNFATSNKFLTWILGGLNFQVEHHLFPKISHVHYPALNDIVKMTCKEFNVHYNEFRTIGDSFQSHRKMIYEMSCQQNQYE